MCVGGLECHAEYWDVSWSISILLPKIILVVGLFSCQHRSLKSVSWIQSCCFNCEWPVWGWGLRKGRAFRGVTDIQQVEKILIWMRTKKIGNEQEGKQNQIWQETNAINTEKECTG